VRMCLPACCPAAPACCTCCHAPARTPACLLVFAGLLQRISYDAGACFLDAMALEDKMELKKWGAPALRHYLKHHNLPSSGTIPENVERLWPYVERQRQQQLLLQQQLRRVQDGQREQFVEQQRQRQQAEQQKQLRQQQMELRQLQLQRQQQAMSGAAGGAAGQRAAVAYAAHAAAVAVARVRAGRHAGPTGAEGAAAAAAKVQIHH
jgi:hypothetical protein